MANVETKIRFNRVVFQDSHEADVIAVVTTKAELTIEEITIIARYGFEMIRNAENCKGDFEQMVQIIEKKLSRMRHSAIAISYGCLLTKLVDFSYYEIA